jgi:hypothetical protein
MKHNFLLRIFCIGLIGFVYGQQHTAFATTNNQKVQAALSTDLIIFSYNRPMQLFAYLESLEKYVIGIQKKIILYRATQVEDEQGYQVLRERFSDVCFVRQDNAQAGADFKPLLTNIVTQISNSSHIMFGVDDIIVTDYIDVNHSVALLAASGALGFYLRLGKNITQCYMTNKTIDLLDESKLFSIAPKVFAWKFKELAGDWAYPHSVDMTIFDRAYVVGAVTDLQYRAPNSFEAAWSRVQPDRLGGLCYEHSKIVNLPLNAIQHEYNNRCVQQPISVDQLRDLFQKGFKIDIQPLFCCDNKAPHMDYVPLFIKRN